MYDWFAFAKISKLKVEAEHKTRSLPANLGRRFLIYYLCDYVLERRTSLPRCRCETNGQKPNISPADGRDYQADQKQTAATISFHIILPLR